MIPYVDAVDAVDARLMALAEFLGISCETLSLDRGTRHYGKFVEKAVSDRRACFVLNPRVLQRWTGGTEVSTELVSCLVSHFPCLLVHGLSAGSFDSILIAALSQGRLDTVQAIDGADALYEIEKDAKDVCEAFSGLKFGPTNPGNDHVFAVPPDSSAVRRLISIGGRPFMTCMRQDNTEIFLLGSKDVLDLDSPVDGSSLAQHFSRLVPQVMALRHIFGEQCWRPVEQYGCVIIDDPLLRRNYGFLNFEQLLRLAEEYNFHTSIAFIPHNYRRNSPRVVDLFLSHGARLSICFHGCDHTKAEMASSETTLLNTILRTAETRMDRHEATTGLVCDRVMVFPQGAFSVEAMRVLKIRNFRAAVNTLPQPVGHREPLTFRELIQPAVTRYGGFPLFLRRYVKGIQSQDIAFDLLFGKPVLIVEHHEIFEHPELLIEVVRKVNSLAPDIKWARLERVVSSAVLKRKAPDATKQVRAYSGNVRIFNDSNRTETFSIEWNYPEASCSVDQVLNDGTPCAGIEVSEFGVRLSVQLQALSSATFSLVYRNRDSSQNSLGFQSNAKAFVRRRLSELRDNRLSRYPWLLNVARTLKERYLNLL